MAYQSMMARDGTPLLREKGGIDVVDEGNNGTFDEVDGSRVETSASRQGRKRAALGLLILAVGAVSAVSAIGRRSTPQAAVSIEDTTTNLASGASSPTVEAKATVRLSELPDDEVLTLFDQFVSKFEKVYTDDDEAEMRRGIFRRNLKRIDELNDNSRGAVYDVSVWTDMTKKEYKSLQTYGKISDKAKEYGRRNALKLDDLASADTCQACTRYPELSQYIEGDLPTSFDWRDYGAVTLVKNQAYCGSCWSFSTTGCLEGAWYLAGHPLQSLSEQQLVTCDTEWNQGCNGGWPSLSMSYIADNGGIVPESIYPYRKVYMGGATSHAPVCSDVVKDGNYAATLSFEVAVSDTMDEDTMARWLILNGPLSVALDAIGMDYYSSGIDMGEYCEPLEIDHAVLIVGFGEEKGVKYWIIKNSWAISWGERGYYRLVRGENACGIADDVATIIVSDATVS